MNMLAQANVWLNAQRQKHLTVPVQYRRRGGQTVEVPAALGRTLFRVEDEYGITTRTESRDFLIAASDLNVEPERGDQIIYAGVCYEVLAPNSEPCWRWSDSFHQTLRIHTKEIGGEDERRRT